MNRPPWMRWRRIMHPGTPVLVPVVCSSCDHYVTVRGEHVRRVMPYGSTPMKLRVRIPEGLHCCVVHPECEREFNDEQVQVVDAVTLLGELVVDDG